MGIKAYASDASVTLNLLEKTAPHLIDDAGRHYKGEISVFGHVKSGDAFADLVKHDYRKRLCIFNKGRYLFIGPSMASISDPCPFCLLLLLSIDKYAVASLNEETGAPRPRPQDTRVNIKRAIEGAAYIDIETGKVTYLGRFYRHPACRHAYAASKRTASTHNTKQRNKASTAELIAVLKDKNTGVIRGLADFYSLSKVPPQLRFRGFKIAVGWYFDPYFPLNTDSKFVVADYGGSFSKAHSVRRAVFEMIERFCAASPSQRPAQVVGSYAALNRDYDLVDPESVVGYSEKQYAVAGFPFKKFTRKSNVRWIESEDQDGRPRYVPSEFIYMNDWERPRYTDCNTNGCAAHIEISSARLNAALELVERDNLVRHWLSGKGSIVIDNATLPDGVKDILTEIDRLGFETRIIDCSRFDGIFAFEVALINKVGGRAPAIRICSAASTDPLRAVGKALDESTTSLVLDLFLEKRVRLVIPARAKVLSPADHINFYSSQNHYKLLEGHLEIETLRDFASLKASLSSEHDAELLQKLCGRLKSNGVDVLFSDITLDYIRSLGVTVTRAFSPQLVPISFGTGLLKLDAAEDDSDFFLRYPHPFA